MNSIPQEDTILQEAQKRLVRLSPEKLRVVVDFIAYLEDREESEATAELLNIPSFQEDLQQALREAEAGEVVRFDSIHRHV